MSLTEAIKHDVEKPRTDLLPVEALLEVSKVLSFGAAKYEDENWRRGFKWNRLYAAALRHMFAWKMGEDNDDETSINHIAHACCCLLFLLTSQLLNLGEDDRWRKDNE